MTRLRFGGVVVASVAFSVGCSQADADRADSAIDKVATTSRGDITTSTEFVDTNGTDPNPDQSQPSSAWWVLDPSFTPTADSTSLRLIVTEKSCASGMSPMGRIEATAFFTETEVVVTVIVNTVGGAANCPGNPATPFTAQLTEPLGDRVVVGEDPPP
jgi:hypothetical protein